MSNTFGNIAQLIFDNGYTPLPIVFREKRPPIKAWQQYVFNPSDLKTHAHCGVGILTGNVVGVDIDLLRESLAKEFTALAVERFGLAPSRIGKAPKNLLMYRAEEPFGKIQTPMYRFADDQPISKDFKGHKVEVLAEGQQFVAFNIHKDTGQPYVWNGKGSPLDTKRDQLPLLTKAQAADFVAECERRIIAAGGAKIGRMTAAEAQREHKPNEKFLAEDPDECRSALEACPNEDEDYDDWIKMMYAVKGAFEDPNEGLELFLKWSRKSPEKHDEKATVEYWNRAHPDRSGAGSIYHWARTFGGWKRPEKAPAFVMLGPEASVGTYDEWHGVPFAAPNIVDNFLPEDAGGSVGPGGWGKTTLALMESVRIRLGLPLYGREVVRSGGTLMITAEDSRPLVFGRLNEICRAMNLSEQEVEHVRVGIHVEDVTGCLARIAQVDRNGTVQPGVLFYQTLEKYANAGLATVIIDPVSLLGPGETFGNDGAAELLRVCRVMARELKCATRLIHHVSQNVARNGVMDQYVARGGTAFVDNSRFQHQLIVVDERKLTVPLWGAFDVPEGATDLDLAKGRVLAILVHKLSYQERDRVPIFLLRRGFEFIQLAARESGPLSLVQSDAAAAKDSREVWALVAHHFVKGTLLTATRLETTYREVLGMSQGRIRRAVEAALQVGAFVRRELPKDQQQGAAKLYLHPADNYPM